MSKMSRSTSKYPLFAATAIAIASIACLAYVLHWRPPSEGSKSQTKAAAVTPATGKAPVTKTVTDSNGNKLATFTVGARTVLMHGPTRTFAERANTAATITSPDWVRLYPKPFDGTVDQAWLQAAVADNNSPSKPDLIAIAMQYITGAPTIKDDTGRIIAGSASYGPTMPDGEREEGSDFNDYLGISYTYGTEVDKPEARQLGSLDCSGFQRMIWGYRSGIPLELRPTGTAIPRQAYQMYDSLPGIVVIPNIGKQVNDFSRLQVGDLVFHDASDDDGTKIDHVGVYLGLDSNGDRRFISSRKKANGPTFGDLGGRSVLNGRGSYAETFRAVRRF